jgi:hypothetical protein
MLNILAASHRNWRAAVWLVEHMRRNPPALTPEEKAERHQEELEDARRHGELAHVLHESASGRQTSVRTKRR